MTAAAAGAAPAFAEYQGRRVVVTGCSSGIGLALARTLVELGAEVIGMSRREPDVSLASFVPLDLTAADSVEQAAAEVTGHVDALFSCAGAPPTLPSLELLKVNFLGTRLLTERLLDALTGGGAIAVVSSSNGAGWRGSTDVLREFLETETFQDGAAWYEQNEELAGHAYPFSKQALTLWAMQQAAPLVTRGIRINTSSPGAVQTPLLEAAEQVFPAEALGVVEQPSGRRSQVAEQVGPLLFLNSPHASYVTGADLAVDGGHTAWLATQALAATQGVPS